MRRVALILAMGVAIAACSGDDQAADTTSVGEAADRSEFASGEDTVTTRPARRHSPTRAMARSPSTSKWHRIAR